MGVGYINIGKYEKALEAHKKPLNVSKTQDDIHNIAVLELEIDECYFRLNEPDKALYFFNLAQEKFDADNSPTSLGYIYIPLTINNNQIGVLTVQSFSENAYTKTHLDIIQNIGINTAIALENANSYKIIRKKNEEIKGSIKYAQKLQYAFLPLKEDIDMSLNNYIIYKPKDIISGDFYWHKVIRTKTKLITFIVVSDCTGHGIPGALMSGIGIGILKDTVPKKMETDEILEYLNFEVKNVLKQEQTKNNDGMDVCLCKIEKISTGITKVIFTGAKRPLIYYNSKIQTIKLIKGNLKTIGSNYIQDQKFKKQNLF